MGLIDINRYVTEQSTTTVHHHVTEKRAPTDESVRLLREMEQAAQSKVDRAIRLSGCPVDVVIHTSYECRNAGHSYAIHYMLGSHRRKVEMFIPFERHATTADELRDALAQDIASGILNGAFQSINLKGSQ